MKNSKQKIVVIGAKGRLGSCLVWRMQNSRLARRFETVSISRGDNISALVDGAEAIVLAVKPDQLYQVAQKLGGQLSRDQLLISIVSRKSARTVSELFGIESIIRATTNVGVSIGKGSTVCIAPFGLRPAHKKLAAKLFNNWGRTYWQTEEKIISGSVVATGCMPAIHARDIKQSIYASIQLGLESPLATALVMDSLEATLALYRSDPERALEEIERMVVTPGGITEKILSLLPDGVNKEVAFRMALSRRPSSSQITD